MSANKTRPTDTDVDAFVDGVKNARRREDARTVLEAMREVADEPPRMWGSTIVGCGVHRYPLAGGKRGEICKIGFAPRAQATVLYLGDFPGRDDCLARLGKHDTGVGCIYIKRVDEVDPTVLREMLERAYARPDEA